MYVTCDPARAGGQPPLPPSFRLRVHGPAGTSTHTLRSGGAAQIVIGRDPACDVMLTDPLASRRHVAIRLRAREIEAEDLGSRNGTFLDGARLSPNVATTVPPSGILRIGETLVSFEESSETTWCFDRPTFEGRLSRLLAQPRQRDQGPGLVEITWSAMDKGTTSTTTSSEALRQLLARLAGPRGIVGAYDPSQLLVVFPETTPSQLVEATADIKRACSELGIGAQFALALATRDTRTVADLLLARRRDTDAHARARTLPPPAPHVPHVVFQGALRAVEGLLARFESNDSPVLITGETGVGKDVLARTIHARSSRASRPLVVLNSASFSEALFESELFGHERGAFTGAAMQKTGLLETASGGTIFLDEIGELPLGMQVKLLRVIENREILRVGGLTPRPIDVRFLCATNRDLREEIERGTFRRDFFFRIGTLTLRIPPLRERVAEIAPLADVFVRVAAAKLGRPPPRIAPETLRYLEAHAWPGNVRELKNVLDVSVHLLDGDVLEPSGVHIDHFVRWDSEPAAVSVGPDSVAASARPPSDDLSERDRIIAALETCVWNQSAAAKMLGIPRPSLIKKIEHYGLPRPRKRP